MSIKSWQDYPEFLERFEEEMGVSAEDLEGLTLDELASALADFNIASATRDTARSLRWTLDAMSEEGIEGARLEYLDKQDRYIWRDIETGRFTKMPSGFE